MNVVSVPTPDGAETVATEVTDNAATTSEPGGRLPPRGLFFLGLVVGLGRWLFAADRRIWHITADEPATMGMARWISGTGDWTMFSAATWRPGFSTLIAPVYWLTDDQVTIFRATLVANAAIAAVSAVVLALIVRRITDLGPLAVIVVSGAIALTPSSLSASAHAWAEPLITLLFLISVWLVMTYLDGFSGTLRARPALLAVATGAIGLATHGRLEPLAALLAVATIGPALVRSRWRLAIQLSVFAAASYSAAHLYTRFVTANVWDQPNSINSAGSVFRRLGRPLDVLDSAAGQIWYQIAATAGVAAIGLAVLIRTAFESNRLGPARRDAAVLLFLSIPLVGVSIVFMADRIRPDQLVYGRYIDAISWPVLALGVSWLLGGLRAWTPRQRIVLIGAVASLHVSIGLFLDQFHGAQLRGPGAVDAMIPGVQIYTGSNPSIPPLRITVLSLSAFALVVVAAHAARRASHLFAALALVFLGIGAFAMHRAGPTRNFSEGLAVVERVADEVPPDTRLGVRFMPDELNPTVPVSTQFNWALLYQWYLPDFEFVRDRGDDDVGPYVFSPANDPIFQLREAESVWSSPSGLILLWLDPPQDVAGVERTLVADPPQVD